MIFLYESSGRVTKYDNVIYSFIHNIYIYISMNTCLATCFGSREASSGHFLINRHGAFSQCAHYGTPYCLQTIFILKFKFKFYWPMYLLNICKNSYQYFSKSLLEFYASLYIYIYCELNQSSYQMNV